MAEKREKALHELLSRTMVDIYVGPENTHYILHEKLLCYRSPFFASIFYDKSKDEGRSKDLGLPDDEEGPFNMFVGWLYSGILPVPEKEQDLAALFEVYLMGEKWSIDRLKETVVETVRTFYHSTGTYPGLRRVQYIYANTADGSPMRQLFVESIARFLTLSEEIPQHWAKALRNNGPLAVDIIRAIHDWHIESRSVPDPREASVDRGRSPGNIKLNGHFNGDVAGHDKPNGRIEVDEHINGDSQTNGLNGIEHS
ncbi:hypothetical protein L228DRAFT_269944 [Xylona heveae TC161]|uniref:BTB domain-containing protein n=1 Tax=Xylona heveae (strain CBS 132557 / TC161) TaxID=1328760 RepID=A0A165AKP9_XYLHT|nr:hypothetical protein L228DRAFT_269944 [Xylona heveae TC161]KZF20645.1 hypothetical protein L228DRAFT_269944 [Xylona heveae TC161]